MKKGFKGSAMIILFFTMILAVACSSSDKGGQNNGGNKPENTESQAQNNVTAAKPKDPDPVTIYFYNPSSSSTEEVFNEFYGDRIRSKFPHVTIDYKHAPDTNPEGQLTAMIAAKESIDIMFNSDANHYRLIQPFGLGSDISDLVKKNNFDLNTIEPSAIDSVRAVAPGELQALPISMSNHVLMYNKDLFDTFGKEEPRDGMTWDEVYVLAQEMTRTEGDVQYKGLVTQMYNIGLQNQLSVGYVDPETHQPLFVKDDRWAQVTNNIHRFFQIPNNGLTSSTRYFTPIHNMFFIDKIAAMYVYGFPGQEMDVNWDAVTYPQLKEKPNVGPQPTLTLAYITSLSQNRDVSFEILAYMTSPEFQESLARRAMMPVSLDKKAIENFGADAPHLQGKNIKAVFYDNPASPPGKTPYDRAVGGIYEQMLYDLAVGLKDVNTALRDAQEQAEMKIKELKEMAD